MNHESNSGQRNLARQLNESAFNTPKPPTTPSAVAVLAVLGGCLFAVLLVIGIAILGVAYYFQQQRIREVQQMARLEEQQRVVAIERERANAIAREARLAGEGARRQIEQQQALEQAQERRDRARLVERQARIEEQQRDNEHEARQGLDVIQTALFRKIRINDPGSVIAPGTANSSGLSWRVHLLPTLGLKSLHSQFHLDEAWDSEHNKLLIEKMPAMFGAEPQTGMTQIRSFLRLDGNGGTHTRLRDIPDGIEQTALLVEVGKDFAIPWTQPDNVQRFTAVTPESIGIADGEVIRFTLCSSQNVLNVTSMPPAVLRAICSPAGGEHLDSELIAGQAPGHAAAVRIASLPTSTEFAAATPLSHEQESSLCHEKLAQIAQAFVNREQQLKTQVDPEPSSPSPLSWRVHLLPFLGEEKLFARFDLSQPWNSEANLPLASEMPKIYQIGEYAGRTRFILSLPKDCKRTTGQMPAVGAITDAPELTTLLYLAAPHRGVTWTQPDSVDQFSGSLHESLGWPESVKLIAATFAGTTIEIPGYLHRSKLMALTSTNRGETFDLPLALLDPEQQLRLMPSIKPAEPIADLIKLPKLSVNPATLKPAVLSKDAARFRPLYIAMHGYYDRLRHSPANVQSSAGVRSQLSWRVHLLPFLEQQPLYDRFKLDEPWDSEHNQTLLEFMPEIFKSSPEAVSTTRLRVLSGKGSLFAGGNNWMRIEDGILNTMMLIETGDPFEQEWTKPDTEIEISSLDYAALFGNKKEISALMGNGQVLRFTADTPIAIFRALASANGNEIVDAQTVQRWLAHQRGESMFPTQVESRWESEQMQSIAMAAMNHHDIFQFYPPQQSKALDGSVPLKSCQLSWRVHLLPYLGHEAMYKQFRMEEPWDSSHNIQLLSSMPDCYRDADDSTDSQTTRIVRFMGPGTPFPEPGRAPAMRDIKDGSSNTIHFIQAPATDAVPWTQPEDLLVNINDAASDELFKRLASTPALKTVTFDGAVRSLAPNISVESLKGLVTPSGSEVLKTGELFLAN